MADLIYNRFSYNIVTKRIDLVNDNIKAALLTSSYVPDAKNHNVWADVSANEVSGTGYTTGGIALASKAVYEDETNGWTWWDANDITWSNSTITARYLVLYDTTLVGSDLIALFDFTSDKISTGGDFIITWSASGILRLV